MSKKILDFETKQGAIAELWGDLAIMPTFYIEGVAHADFAENIMRFTVYNSTGVIGASGEVTNAVARLVMSRNDLNHFIFQLQELSRHFIQEGETDPRIGATSQPQLDAERPAIGARIA